MINLRVSSGYFVNRVATSAACHVCAAANARSLPIPGINEPIDNYATLDWSRWWKRYKTVGLHHNHLEDIVAVCISCKTESATNKVRASEGMAAPNTGACPARKSCVGMRPVASDPYQTRGECAARNSCGGLVVGCTCAAFGQAADHRFLGAPTAAFQKPWVDAFGQRRDSSSTSCFRG